MQISTSPSACSATMVSVAVESVANNGSGSSSLLDAALLQELPLLDRGGGIAQQLSARTFVDGTKNNVAR